MTLTLPNVPASILEKFRALSEQRQRSMEDVIIEALEAWPKAREAASADSVHLLLDPPTLTDEGPPPGDIPLPGPSVVVKPVSAGSLLPDPPLVRGVDIP